MFIIIKNNKNNMNIYLDNFFYKLNKKNTKNTNPTHFTEQKKKVKFNKIK